MAERLHLEPRHRKMLEALLREHLPGVEVWAYGSRVTGRGHDGSDLDLVLRGPGLEPIPFERLIDFEEAVRESTIPFLVEAKDWARLPERFHREIEGGYVVVGGGTDAQRRSASKPMASSEPAASWPTVTVEDLAEKVAMGPFGSSIKVSTFVPDGVPIISGQHLHGIRVDDAPGFNFISHEHADRLKNANVRRGDVVLTHRGTIGQVSYIPEDSQFDRYVASQSQFYVRCDPLRAIGEFVALYFTSPEGQHQLLANTSQVGVPSIAQPVTYLRTIGIPLPPLPEQRAIAHILGTLDDKIDLNRRMNETLEAMARALFKSWFVDFDPVRARMEGRDTGLPPDIADLFPDRLVDSEMGEIPEGWAVFRLDQLATHHTKSVAPHRSPGVEYEHFSIPAHDAGRNPSIELGTAIKSNKTEVQRDAVLVSKLNPQIPRVWMPGEESHRPRVCSTEFLVFTPRPPANRSLLYSLCAAQRFRALLESMVTGTSKSHQRVPPKALKAQVVLAGSPKVFAGFDDVTGPALARILKNRSESRTLAALRDTLLPKLISGEIRVPDLERTMEATA